MLPIITPAQPKNPTAEDSLQQVTNTALVASITHFGYKGAEYTSSPTLQEKEQGAPATNQQNTSSTSADLKEEVKELKQQNERTHKELATLKRQNALILSKMYDLEEIVSQIYERINGQTLNGQESSLYQKTDFLTPENEANEHPLTRRGVIIMETDRATTEKADC